MKEKLSLADLSPINQAMLFALNDLEYEIVCVKQLFHKTEEDMWMVLPKGLSLTKYVLGSVDINILLSQVLNSPCLFNGFIDHFDLSEHMWRSEEVPYNDLNKNKLELFILGRYSSHVVSDNFTIQEDDDYVRIVKLDSVTDPWLPAPLSIKPLSLQNP